MEHPTFKSYHLLGTAPMDPALKNNDVVRHCGGCFCSGHWRQHCVVLLLQHLFHLSGLVIAILTMKIPMTMLTASVKSLITRLFASNLRSLTTVKSGAARRNIDPNPYTQHNGYGEFFNVNKLGEDLKGVFWQEQWLSILLGVHKVSLKI